MYRFSQNLPIQQKIHLQNSSDISADLFCLRNYSLCGKKLNGTRTKCTTIKGPFCLCPVCFMSYICLSTLSNNCHRKMKLNTQECTLIDGSNGKNTYSLKGNNLLALSGLTHSLTSLRILHLNFNKEELQTMQKNVE